MPGPLDWLQQMLGGSTEGTGLGYASEATDPGAMEALKRRLAQTWADTSRAGSTIGNYLAEAPAKAIDYAGNQVAAPFLQGQADLMARDWSQVPLVDKEGGRVGALGSYLSPYLYGGAPAGSTSAGIRAYHASPFDFDKFKANPRAGTGGLSQGYGTYVAEAEPVSLDYLKQFQERSAKWEPPTGSTVTTPFNDVLRAAEAVKGNLPHSALIPHPQEVYGNLVTTMKGGGGLENYLAANAAGWGPQKLAMYQAGIDALRDWRWNPGKGHMYEVDVHADPNRFLNWDLPLAQQTNVVENAVRDITKQSNIPISPMGEMVGARAYQDMAEYFRRSGMPEDEAYRLVSELLQKEGVPGTRYADMFSRNLPDARTRPLIEDQLAKLRSLPPAYTTANDLREIKMLEDKLTRQPTYNMAVTDPGIIEIMRKYGLLPPLAAGAAGGLLGSE